jgi:hypothetical protein
MVSFREVRLICSVIMSPQSDDSKQNLPVERRAGRRAFLLVESGFAFAAIASLQQLSNVWLV